MTPTPWRVCLGFAAGVLLANRSAAQPPSVEAELAPINSHQASLFRIPGIFEIDLPTTERAGSVQLSFQPRFQDLLDKNYLRLPLGLRWGVNDHFELNSDIETHIDSGLRGTRSSYGFTALHFGAKYAWHDWLKPTWDTSAGFNSSFPVSRPPLDLTDGHDHFAPYIVFGRKVPGAPGLSGFIHAGLDFMWKSATPGVFARNEPHSNSATLSSGLIYDRKAFHYALEIDATTTSLVGTGHHYFVTVRPGIVWDLPDQLKLYARGRWLVGFIVNSTFGPDGNTIGTGGRFRGEINLTRLLGRNRPDRDPPDPPPPGR